MNYNDIKHPLKTIYIHIYIYIYPMWYPIISHENLHLTIRHKMSIESMEGVLDDWQSHFDFDFWSQNVWISMEICGTQFHQISLTLLVSKHQNPRYKHVWTLFPDLYLQEIKISASHPALHLPEGSCRPHWQMLLGDCDYFSHPTPIWGSYQQHAPCSVSSRCCCVERKKPPDKNLCTL